jgi:hypothetical protein
MREATPEITNLCYSGILDQQGCSYGVTEDTAATGGAEILSDGSGRRGRGSHTPICLSVEMDHSGDTPYTHLQSLSTQTR